MATSKKFRIDESEYEVGKKRTPEVYTQNVQNTQNVQTREPIENPMVNDADELDSKKAVKKPVRKNAYQMNLHLPDDMVEYVKRESMVRGYTITKFLTMIIKEYMSDPDNKHYVD